MADFEQDPTGQPDERVRLVFGNEETHIFESYSVKTAILQQPSAFTIVVGNSQSVSLILASLPNNTKFQLQVGDVPQFTGYTDGRSGQSGSSGSTASVKGRDVLGLLFSAKVKAERSFVDVTYADLVLAAMEAVGIEGDLIADNRANREVRGGKGVTTTGGGGGAAPSGGGGSSPRNVTVHSILAAGAEGTNAGVRSLTDIILSESAKAAAKTATLAPANSDKRLAPGAKGAALGVSAAGGEGGGSPAAKRHTVIAKLGERWLEFLRRHLEKIGLFLWSDAFGNIVLATPDKDQTPKHLFKRTRAGDRTAVNVTDAKFTDDATNRYSRVTVYSRHRGAGKGKGKIIGSWADPEMVALGIDREEVVNDANVFDEAQAEKYAKHKLAELNRAAWRLTYTISGHTAPGPNGEGRTVVIPDTIAHVEDEEFGISADLYIESVEYHSPPRSTVITMMRPQDVVFEPDPTVVEVVATAKKGRSRRKRK